jgi:agmatinase
MSTLEAKMGEVLAGDVVLLGLPTDEGGTFLAGTAGGPARIREVLHAGATNLCAENGHDLAADPRLKDLGDLDLESGEAGRRQIEERAQRIVKLGARVLALGGDHSVTYPLIRGYAGAGLKPTILHFDAHPDLYDEYDGKRYSNASPFARIMEENLAIRLVQVGIRTMNPHQRRQVKRFGVEVIEARDVGPQTRVDLDGLVYITVDLDVLDPAHAPGVSHHEPGGLCTRDVLRLVQAVRGTVVGADIVELNPRRDPVETTAMVAAKLLKELAAKMLEGHHPGGSDAGAGVPAQTPGSPR